MMDEYIKRADAMEAIRKWCGDCGSAIEAVLSVPAARGLEPDGVTNLLRDVVRGAKPVTPFVQEYAIDLQDQQLDTDVACDFVAAKYLDGQEDEDHLLAAAWNILWAIEMRCKKPECVDTPWRDNAKG